MSSPNGQHVITYNGEIYNHVELRKELESLGFRFRSNSDTEVILAAYAHWGTRCVDRFNGMWAFAIWDRVKRQLFCSRDRFGVKPFYYIEIKDGLIFGSEIRQLLPWIDQRKADSQRVHEFLLTGMTDHTDGTFFARVHKLLAGHNLFWKADSGKWHVERYFRLQRDASLSTLSVADAVDLYRELFQDSVKLRLRSDVPVGTCLSGGLDSSSVAVVAAPHYSQLAGQPFCAITAISEQADNSEEKYAKLVAGSVGLDWLQVKPSFDTLLAQLPAVVRTQEEPFGSASIVMQYAVMERARAASIPVLLDGQGGDETLLGYPKYVAAYLASQWSAHGLTGLFSGIRSASGNHHSWSLPHMFKYLVGARFANLRYAYYRQQNNFLRAAPPLPFFLRQFSQVCTDEFELQRLEIEQTNLPALLRYEDKNSMAHSVETRLPFLDYRLVEFSLSLSGSMKIRDGWTKWLLREAMQNNLPREVAWRKDKIGFEAPERNWHNRLMPQMLKSVMGSSIVADISNTKRLAQSFSQLPPRSQWRLFSLALWEKEFSISGLT